MQSFNFYAPTEIVFGKDAENQVPAKIKGYGGSRVFVVYGGGSVVRSGLLGRLEKSLADSGLAYESFGGAQANPLVSHAREGIKRSIAFRADFILAVGGGSAIDTAKAIGIGTANPDTDFWEFWTGKPVAIGTPMGCVVTISAAGSEMSESAVLTDDQGTGIKRGLSVRINRPMFAAMNPELTYTLPVHQVACGVVDIMMHTLDRYFNPITTNELTDQIAESLLRVVIKNGRIAVKNTHDYQAMSELMWASSLSHNDITGAGGAKDFAPHALSQELSARFGSAHGAALSAVWGSWAQYCLSTNPARFAQYGRQVWNIHRDTELETAKAAIETTVDYFKELEMPTCFTELGVAVQDDAALRDMAVRVTYYGKRSVVGTFLPLKEDDIYEIYRLANR